MARCEDHCEESIRLFGQPYEGVYRWPDAFAGTKEHGYRHREKRYHDAGPTDEQDYVKMGLF